MISAFTLLYQYQRKQDAEGYLLATPDDYERAAHLLKEPLRRLLGYGISEPAQRFWERLKERYYDPLKPFTPREARQNERVSKAATYGWLRELAEAGAIRVIEPAEGSKGAKYEVGEYVPTCPLLLPDVEKLEETAPYETAGHKM